jgi:hypothetical protein
MEASQAQIEPTKVIGEAFDVYGKYVGPLLGGALILIGIAAVINGVCAASGSLGLVLVGLAVTIVAQVLYTGYVVKLVQDVRDGRLDDSMGELFSAALPYVGTLILNGIIYGIAVTIGFVLLIVPGLILVTIWAVVAPSIVVENRGAIEAFGRSRELVRGNGWPVFGVVVLAFLIIVAGSVIAGGIGAAIADDAGRIILQAIASVLLVPIGALVSAILFYDLGGGAGAIEPTPQPAA